MTRKRKTPKGAQNMTAREKAQRAQMIKRQGGHWRQHPTAGEIWVKNPGRKKRRAK